MEKNQKIIIVSLIIVLAVLLIASSFIGSDNKENKSNVLSNDPNQIMKNVQTESNNINQAERKKSTEINTDTYLEYLKGTENKLILVARPTCSACQLAYPIVENVAYKYNLEIFYLNTDNFGGEDEANFVRSNEMFSEGFGTPMLLAVSNNKIVDYIDGVTDTAHYEDFLKKHNFIK